MFAKPQSEHAWLDKLLGDWTFESECLMGPDKPPAKSSGLLHCRTLGGLWIICEGEAEPQGDMECKSIITLGYDPDAKRYIGTFIASMMTSLWIYAGSLDPSGKKLILDTEGPKFDQSGLAKYQDIIEWINDTHWIMTSQLQGDDGRWHQFMTAHYHSKK